MRKWLRNYKNNKKLLVLLRAVIDGVDIEEVVRYYKTTYSKFVQILQDLEAKGLLNLHRFTVTITDKGIEILNKLEKGSWIEKFKKHD